MRMLPVSLSLQSRRGENYDPIYSSGLIRFNQPRTNSSNKSCGFQLLSLLLGLIALGSSVALSGCGGITANADAKSGGGSAGSLTLSPSTVAFGSVSMGSPATSQVKLTNSTSSAVVVSALTVSGGTFTVDGLGTLPATVAANSNATLNVHFSPTAAGSASGQLVIANNSLVSPSLTVTLTGSGTAAFGNASGRRPHGERYDHNIRKCDPELACNSINHAQIHGNVGGYGKRSQHYGDRFHSIGRYISTYAEFGTDCDTERPVQADRSWRFDWNSHGQKQCQLQQYNDSCSQWSRCCDGS